MHPILIKAGPLSLYSYGLMVALGFSIAALLAYRQAPRFGLDREKIIDLFLVLLISGIAGARLLYVVVNISYYRVHPIEVINLSKGGLIWYGAFVSGLLASVWFIRKYAIDFWNGGDLIAPYLALAQAVGRIGCFLNGCCYGIEAPADYACAVVFPHENILRHPTQLYASLALFLIFIILRFWQERRHFTGEIFLAYGILYSVKRFLLEFLRGDNPKILFDLTMSQAASILIGILCIAVFIYKAVVWKKSSTRSA